MQAYLLSRIRPVLWVYLRKNIFIARENISQYIFYVLKLKFRKSRIQKKYQIKLNRPKSNFYLQNTLGCIVLGEYRTYRKKQS